MKTYPYRCTDVGMIIYSTYWKTYSVILRVEEDNGLTWEQTLAPKTADQGKVRRHYTPRQANDRLLSFEEYLNEIANSQ